MAKRTIRVDLILSTVIASTFGLGLFDAWFLFVEYPIENLELSFRPLIRAVFYLGLALFLTFIKIIVAELKN